MKIRKGVSGAAVFFLILIIIGIIVVTVDLVNCPNCGNIPIIRNVDSYCNFDGKVPILHYLMYILG